jgi:hypothetical protein
MAPGHSAAYWQLLCRSYSKQLAQQQDPKALPYMLATGDVDGKNDRGHYSLVPAYVCFVRVSMSVRFCVYAYKNDSLCSLV